MEKVWLKHYDPGVPSTIEYPAHPLHTFLEQAASRYSEQAALLYRGAELQYGSLQELVDRFAAALHKLDLEKGERVAIQLPTCPQFLIAYYAAVKLGAVAVPLNPLLVARETLYFLRDSGARLLVTTDNKPLVDKLRGRVKLDAVITSNLESYAPLLVRLLGRFRVSGGEKPAPGYPALYRMEDLISESGQPPRVRLTATDSAVILYSGGSSGAPMGAVLTHGNLTANVLQCLHWNPALGQDGRETVLVALPLSHSYGMTIGMNLGLATASRLALMPRFDPGEVMDLVEQSRVTYFPGVPSMFEALLKSPDLRKYNLRSIKSCLSGGAPLPLEVQQDFEAVTGGRLIEGYGLAEASPVTHSNPYRAARRAGSIGLPVPDTEVKVVDLHRPDRELPPGAVGELCVKGPQVMQGYFNAPAETASVLQDGWLLTGDIVHMDEDGYTYIVDRKKDMIISGGYNVYPAEVQAVLQSHPRIARADVSSQRDPYKGETLLAVITPAEDATVSEAEILHFCRENLAAFKIPRYIEIRPQNK